MTQRFVGLNIVRSQLCPVLKLEMFLHNLFQVLMHLQLGAGDSTRIGVQVGTDLP